MQIAKPLFFSITIYLVLRCGGVFFKAAGKHPDILNVYQIIEREIFFHDKAFDKQCFAKTTERICNAFENSLYMFVSLAVYFSYCTESRSVLLPMVVGQLGNEMIKTEEKICIDILNDILITLTRKDVVS